MLEHLSKRGFVTLPEDVGFYSGMIPNLGFNIAMSVIFGLFMIFNLVVFIPYKQWWFSTCFSIFTLMEFIGYIGRCLSHNDIFSENPFLQQYVCLTIAPVFAMAGIYYQLLKLTMIYGPQYSRLKPMTYSYIFIGCDIVSIVVQAVGGGIASANDNNKPGRDLGTHIFVAGLLLQVASMTVFLLFFLDFQFSIYVKLARKNPGVNLEDLYNPEYRAIRARRGFKYFNLLLTIAVLFIYVRCIYRVAELAQGWSGNLITHEIYFVILDLLMVSVASLILVPFFPGFMFDGRHINVGVDGFKKSFSPDKRPKKMEDEENDNATMGKEPELF